MSAPRPFKHLLPGRRYRIARPIRDWFGADWPAGQVWTYVTHGFVPYHDGLTLTFSDDSGVEKALQLQWIPEEQGAIIDTLEDYLIES